MSSSFLAFLWRSFFPFPYIEREGEGERGREKERERGREREGEHEGQTVQDVSYLLLLFSLFLGLL